MIVTLVCFTARSVPGQAGKAEVRGPAPAAGTCFCSLLRPLEIDVTEDNCTLTNDQTLGIHIQRCLLYCILTGEIVYESSALHMDWWKCDRDHVWFHLQQAINDENIRKQEESVHKQEAMRKGEEQEHPLHLHRHYWWHWSISSKEMLHCIVEGDEGMVEWLLTAAYDLKSLHCHGLWCRLFWLKEPEPLINYT